MIPSRFTVRVPMPSRQEVFLLHTLTDAQARAMLDKALKVDDALIAASGELQKVLTPEEWNAFVGRVSSAP